MIVHNPDELAMFVKQARKRLKLNQSDIGDAVGLKQATVSAFETQPDSTKIDTLFRILSAANLDIHLCPKGENTKKNGWEEEW